MNTSRDTAAGDTPAPTAAATATGAATATATAGIEEARREIDALDDRIVALIRERMAVSERIQRTRLASGGRRVHLAREMEILRRYREELGRPGTQLAMTLLELCRGRA
ncbi:chorismate mutase [Streptomyces sp. 6N223]|uniref:chorismate mutase n=1 Tax=Streptomyces sp. 6N223 TaxID=3457412 RepID=UPI003FCEF4F7